MIMHLRFILGNFEFKLGRDILLEAMLISKCDGFVYTTTNVSEFVKFLDEKKN